MKPARQPIVSELSRRRKLRLLLDNLGPGSRILEVGSGDGWFTGHLRARGHLVTSMDLDSKADINGDIRNWKNLGLEKDTFDAVVALEVIEHVDCLEDLSALCKRDGLIMLSSPHPNWDWTMKLLEHLRLTQRRTSPHVNLTDFRRVGLRVVELRRPMWIHQVAIFRNLRTGTSLYRDGRRMR